MKLIFLAVLAFAASTAQARPLLFILRADLDRSEFNSAASAGSESNVDSDRFVVQTGRLQYEGELTEDLVFVTRLRFDTVPGPIANRTDNLNNTVDVAFFEHRVTDDLNISLGKVSTDILADDGIPATEIYLPSRARADIFTYLYGTGLKVSKRFSHGTINQTLKLMVLNQSDVTVADQSKFFFGSVYEGELLGKTLFPVLSFHKDQPERAAAPNAKASVEMIAVGLRYEPKPYSISIDYLANSRENISGTGAAARLEAGRSNRLTTFLLDASYAWEGRWRTKLRLDISKNRALVDSDIHGMSVVAEYFPIKENELFRYHVAWTRLLTMPETGARQTNQHFIVGARIVADFLK